MSAALSKVADSWPRLFVEMVWRTGRRPRGEVFGRARARLAQLTPGHMHTLPSPNTLLGEQAISSVNNRQLAI